MLVFGDLATRRPGRESLRASIACFRRWIDAAPGLERFAGLANAYVETARVAQGCVDEEFARAGADDLTPLHEAALNALGAMARVLQSSWGDDGEAASFDGAAADAFAALAPDGEVEARVAEGFAFYALYPESCFDVAPADEGPAVVIGVRSIGMALAPLLAQALNATLCVTLRPGGHPFHRECAMAPNLRGRLAALGAARFYVIDEGPGLSGSSFMAAADSIEGAGVARERIVFVASPAQGPGSAASQATRERWSMAQRRILDPQRAIARALATRRILREASGGLWRENHANGGAPANRPYERRKLLVENGDGLWLAKFEGFGALAQCRAEMAQALSDAGFTPRRGETLHGFALQRWIGDARALDAAPREEIVARLADYIAFRASRLAPPPTGGATMDGLFRMARHNCAEALGEDEAAALDAFAPGTDALARAEKPVATDNRMHAWEWIVDEDGAILKCDAVDHCASHDLVGCRDAAWDVAGAVVEFALSRDERAHLLARLDALGLAIDARLLDFFLLAYPAFQLGAATMAAQANEQWPNDAQRWRGEAKRYAAFVRTRA